MSEQKQIKRLNSFQLVGQMLAAMVGIRSSKDRGTDFMNSSNSAWIGAILIFVGALYLGMHLFIYLIQRNVAG